MGVKYAGSTARDTLGGEPDGELETKNGETGNQTLTVRRQERV